MLNQLVAARPKVVVLVSNGTEQPIKDFLTLWKQENFRTLVVLISDHVRDAERIDNWLAEPGAAAAVDHVRVPLGDIVPEIVRQITAELPDTHLVIRIRDALGHHRDVDITNCELVERPLLQNYELIQASDLHLMQPSELGADGFVTFFDRSASSWKPYAAGLPWRRDAEALKKVFGALAHVSSRGSGENRVLSIISESGAGGTVLSRMLAFEAALEGYPVLIARPELHQPELLELSRFLHRVHVGAIAGHGDEEITQTDDSFEVPWLIVFDVSHWEGRHFELRTFLKGLTDDGRPFSLRT